MKFISGIADNCVIQRNKSNNSEQSFEGECKSAGTVFAEVLSKGSKKTFFKNLKTGKAAGGHFKGVLKGIPLGGSYDINFMIADKNGKILETVKVKNVLVGDLWLLAGQSNMRGTGRLDFKLPAIDRVRAFYMERRWAPAEDPIHNTWNAEAKVYGGNPAIKVNAPEIGAGPGVSFGQEMFSISGIPQGLIPCAEGGTSMAQWSPDLKKEGDGSLYGASINSLKRTGGKIAGLLWYQGCNECSESLSVDYTEKMIKLIKSFRKDAGDANLPVVIVQIGRQCGALDEGRFMSSIREQQYRLADKIKNLSVVTAVDLDMDDGIHIAGESQNLLGLRIADAMRSFFDKKYKQQPRFEKLEIIKDKYSKKPVLKLSFKNVYGQLVSDGRPSGFMLVSKGEKQRYELNDDWTDTLDNAKAKPLVSFHKVRFEGNDIILYPSVPRIMLGAYDLWYGYGLDPYCNIRDEAGRMLPAFKVKIPLEANPLSRLVSDAEVCENPLYIKETAANMIYRKDINFIKAFGNGSSLQHPARIKLSTPEDKIFYFRIRINVPEEAVINLSFGYDGPIKVFVDSKTVFTDMNGKSPIDRDKAEVKHSFSKGEHEIMVALASVKGAAWGISMRMELLKYPCANNLPRFMIVK